MVERQSLATELTTGETSVGTMLKSMSVNVAEALGYTPLDFLFVDRQHGSPVLTRLEEIVRATDLNDLPVVVRVPREDPSMVTYLLDCGVRGIMVPQVEDPDTVREMSTHVRYRDGRSIASTSRASGFGAKDFEAYVEYVNDDLALLPMIETRAGLESVDAIAALDETTAIVVGPGDLAFSLDTDIGSDHHRAAIDSVFEAAGAHDCAVGIFVSSQAELREFEDVASFVIYGKDVEFVTDHISAVLSDD
jgi:2-keto-3-deoxy-L-rhamnonate aldolase RhmA